jgi:hypothetical protein
VKGFGELNLAVTPTFWERLSVMTDWITPWLGFCREAFVIPTLMSGCLINTPSQVPFFDQVLDRLKTLPGVVAAGAGTRAPLSSCIGSSVPFRDASGEHLTRFLSGFLYDVKPTDIITFLAAVLLLTGASFVACYLPARRASSVDPVKALRIE